MTSYRLFKMAVGSDAGFCVCIARPPTKSLCVIVGPILVFNFRVVRIYGRILGDIEIVSGLH